MEIAQSISKSVAVHRTYIPFTANLYKGYEQGD